MSQNIDVTPMEPGVFGAQVSEGEIVTSHRVSMSNDILDLCRVSPDDTEAQMTIARETFSFLLERETATEIMESFSLDDVAANFPEFSTEIVDRVTAG